MCADNSGVFAQESSLCVEICYLLLVHAYSVVIGFGIMCAKTFSNLGGNALVMLASTKVSGVLSFL